MDIIKLLEQIAKSSRAEVRLGCTNAAVFGGFDRYLLSLLDKLEVSVSPALKQSFIEPARGLMNGYGSWPRSKRQERLDKLFELLRLVEPPSAGVSVTPAATLNTGHDPKIPAPEAWAQKAPTPQASEAPVPKPAASKSSPRGSSSLTTLDTPVQFLKNVGPSRASTLNNMGVFTAYDLLYHFPRAYEDRSNLKQAYQLRHGERESVQGVVVGCQTLKPRRGLNVTKLAIDDGTGIIQAVWFNQAYLKKQLPTGTRLIVTGKVDRGFGAIQINVEDFEVWEPGENIHTGRIVPMYPGSGKLNSRTLRTVIKGLLDTLAPTFEEFLPEELVHKYRLMPLGEALQNLHFPSDMEKVRLAKRRFIFEELFLLQVGLARIKGHFSQKKQGISHPPDAEMIRQFRELLPFGLTAAQERVIHAIGRDMEQPQVMNRLIQGDVGSGKTIVAALALTKSLAGGRQGALMAPTEILAEQHYLNLSQLFQPLGIRVGLLTGSLTKKVKKDTVADISRGLVHIVVGTHALIQEDVTFHNLGLVVIDEQHRFGVKQRGYLQQKGYNPDVLVMTATPIPRTLALTVYGDLDLSVIDELPPGRKPVKTSWVSPGKSREMYRFIGEQAEQGRQIYVVCPLVEESEKLDLEAATSLAQQWQELFPQLKVGLLHGRMKTREKDLVMEQFRQGQLNILVSTTVIEVGVDVPNATVMAIIDADRFGLAQLHQLRGRVGRGEHQSYCLLVSNTHTEEGKARLKIMEKSSDGFVIAEEDLHLRGPGEFFGTRQSGLPDLKVADILRDARVLEVARQEAFLLVEQDPKLTKPEHLALAREVKRKFQDRLDYINIG
ncbi:MAG TPA: ATP-dependent DNA helicase RecG [Bacillota bacterium]|nr:ATP-dependent DNA helicase RecG [Bacillota bacterium]